MEPDERGGDVWPERAVALYCAALVFALLIVGLMLTDARQVAAQSPAPSLTPGPTFTVGATLTPAPQPTKTASPEPTPTPSPLPTSVPTESPSSTPIPLP